MTSAGAAHWPSVGGDTGRSGYQPVDKGGLPVPLHIHKTTQTDITTSVITTGGESSDQRVVYGTRGGTIHQVSLSSGAELIAAVDNRPADPNVLTGLPVNGTTPANRLGEGSVTPVDTSAPSSLGTTIVLHNDNNQDGGTSDLRTGSDIALAIIDQATGVTVLDQSVGPVHPETSSDPARRRANTIHFDTASSPLLDAPDASGVRNLFFVAFRQSASADPAETPCDPDGAFEDEPVQGIRGCDIPAATRLFKVAIRDVATVNAAFTSLDVSATDVPNPNLLASPTLVNLAGTPHVVVAGKDGTLRTFTTGDLLPGPEVTGLGAEVHTASTPVRANGETPGTAMVLYVGANVPSQSGATPASKVHKIVVGAGGELSLGASSPVLAGQAAPGLALTQQSEASGLTGGRVIYSTANNLYALDVNDLTRGAALHVAGGLSAGTSGFSRTTAAASGGFVYIARDNGEQLMLDERTLESVPADASGFQQSPSNLTSPNAGLGQPSISHGFVAYGNGNGLFVYRNQTAPTVSITQPANGETVPRNKVTLKATAYNVRSGVAAVTFLLDGVVAGTDTVPDSGNALSPEDPAVFSVAVDLARFGSGRFVLTAEATDRDTGADAPAEVGVSPPHTIIWSRGH